MRSSAGSPAHHTGSHARKRTPDCFLKLFTVLGRFDLSDCCSLSAGDGDTYILDAAEVRASY